MVPLDNVEGETNRGWKLHSDGVERANQEGLKGTMVIEKPVFKPYFWEVCKTVDAQSPANQLRFG